MQSEELGGAAIAPHAAEHLTPGSPPDALEEAAEIVRRHLAHAAMFADFYIACAWSNGPPGKCPDYRYFDEMRDMVRLSAELAGTLARLKGEVRQRIVVEHVERATPPALIGEGRTAELAPASLGGRGEGVDSAKQLDAVVLHDDPTS